MNNLETTHQQYPKPHVDHHLQVDVTRLAAAFDMVDQDISGVKQDITALQQDQVSNRWQTLDLTQADLQADTFYPVLLGLAPAMGSQVLELRRLQPEAAQEHPTTNWQAGLACLGDVWIGEHNLTLIRYAAAPEQDLLADYHWDQGTGCAVVWLRGQQVYQVRSSHQRLAVIEAATNQATLEAMTTNDVQLQPQGVVLSTTQGSHTYAPRTAIDTDKVKAGQWNLLTFLDMQAALTTHAKQLEQLAQAKAQLADAQAQTQSLLREQLQQQQRALSSELAQQTRMLNRLTYDKPPAVGDIIPRTYHFEYLPCGGQSYPRASYPALAEHLGEATWHEDDQGVASFRMPFQYDGDALQQPTKRFLNSGQYLYGIAVTSARVFLSGHMNFNVCGYDHTGWRQQTFSGLSYTNGLWVEGDRLYVAEYGNNHVQVLATATGKVQQSIGMKGAWNVQVQGYWLWVVRQSGKKVTAYHLQSGESRDIDTQASSASCLAVSDDRLYVGHTGGTYGNQITIYNATTGAFIEAWKPGLNAPLGLAIQGTLLAVVDNNNNRVRLFNRLTKTWLGDIQVAGYHYPVACCFDAHGLWIAWYRDGVTYHDLSKCYASMRALAPGA